MRYGTINSEFWIEDARDINELCGNGIGCSIMHYLKTTQLSNMLGVYHLSLDTLVRSVFFEKESVITAFNILCENGYIFYDNKYDYVWIVEMAIEQTFPGISKKHKDYAKLKLKDGDNRAKSMIDIFNSLPKKLSFRKNIFDKYHNVTLIDSCICWASEGASEGVKNGVAKPLNSKQETVNSKQEIENNITQMTFSSQLKKSKKSTDKVDLDTVSSDVVHLYNFWHDAFGKKRNSVKLGEHGLEKLEFGITEFGVKRCEEVIEGCKLSDWHMGRISAENRYKKTKSIDIETIFRDFKAVNTHLQRFDDAKEAKDNPDKDEADKILERLIKRRNADGNNGTTE